MLAPAQGSDANNIIPDQVAMGGTLRALTHEHMMYLKGRIEDMVASVAAGYRCNGTVDWHLEDHPYYPPTVNNPGAAAFVQEVATELLGSDKVGSTKGGQRAMAGYLRRDCDRMLQMR